MSIAPGRTLRRQRAAAGLSQRALARAAGTSAATVAAYESGTKDPQARTWLRLLSATGAELQAVSTRSGSDRLTDALCARYAELVVADPGLLDIARDVLPRVS